ncbi:MAG: hypothetical protein AAF804_12270, partial [Bacteroidota bacterium]
MQRFITKFTLVLTVVALVALAGCKNTDPEPEPVDPTEDDLFVMSVSMGQESAVMAVFDSMPTGEIDASS